jgi:hypothetical protein
MIIINLTDIIGWGIMIIFFVIAIIYCTYETIVEKMKEIKKKKKREK